LAVKKSAKRVIMRIELSPQAVESFNSATKQLGLKHIAATSRIIDWLIRQDSETQAAILGLMPKEFEFDVVRRAMESMSRDARPRR
jgi:hypothetical protein